MLEQRGHTVSIVSPFPSEQLLDEDRVRLVTSPQQVLLDQPSRIARVLVRLMRLAGQLDLIQLNLPTPAFSMFADLLQTFVRVPVVVGYEAHLLRVRDVLRGNRLWQSPGFYLPRLLVNNSAVAHLTAHRARLYIVNSSHQKDELVRLGLRPERVHILPPVLPHDKRARGSEAMRGLFPAGAHHHLHRAL